MMSAERADMAVLRSYSAGGVSYLHFDVKLHAISD